MDIKQRIIITFDDGTSKELTESEAKNLLYLLEIIFNTTTDTTSN
jgi:hypothetical protein